MSDRDPRRAALRLVASGLAQAAEGLRALAEAPGPDAEKEISASAAAKRLGLSPAQISTYVRDKVIPAARYGRAVRIKLGDLERFRRTREA